MTQPRWIAYELHDGLMQWVIGARMHMAALVAADFETQKAMYVSLIEGVRDTGQFNYTVERVTVAA